MNETTAARTTSDNAPEDRQAAFESEVIQRFGLLPNFFRSAPDAPELTIEFWNFARSAYLDNPLPSLLKERLFVHLSRFCEARYCVVRHVGYLTGRGRPAGDPTAEPFTIEQAVQLLRSRGVPTDTELDAALSRLEACWTPVPPPETGTQAELDVLVAATALFLEPGRAERARDALRIALGGRNFDFLTAYLAFVRAVHYWALTHPGIPFDADMDDLLREHEVLANLLLDDAESGRCDMGQRLFDELTLLRRERDDRAELRQALAERERAQKYQSLLIDELNHRVKNTLAIVQSIASQAMRGSVPEEVREAFTRRLVALAQAHDALTNEGWQGADLRNIIARAVSMQGGAAARLRADGPAVQLGPKMTVSLSMAIHELTTNAIKYGALSNEVGQVDVAWSVAPGAGGDWLKVRWQESGGPRVPPPSHIGFGSRLIERSLAGELGGEVSVAYDPTGLVCTIAAPLHKSERPS